MEQAETIKNCIARQKVTIKSEFDINGNKLETEQRMLTKYEWDSYKKRCLDMTSDETVFKAIMDVKNHERFRLLTKEVPIMEKNVTENVKKIKDLKGKEKIELSSTNSELKRDLESFKVELGKLKNKIEDDDISNETIFILEEAKKKVASFEFENKVWVIAKSLSENTFYSSYLIFDDKEVLGEDITKLVKDLETVIFDELYAKAIELITPTKADLAEVK